MKQPVAAVLAMAATGCSSTSYVQGAPIAAPRLATTMTNATATLPGLDHAAVLSPDRGRVVLDSAPQGASVFELRERAEPRLVCAITPCAEEATIGAHRYRLVPPPASTLQVSSDGRIASKDGTYLSAVDVDVCVTAGKPQMISASLGQTEVRSSFPLGRGTGIAVIAAGLVATLAGAANLSSAPGGSPDQQIGQGWVGLGIGTIFLGGLLLSANLRDNVKVTAHAGTSIVTASASSSPSTGAACPP